MVAYLDRLHDRRLFPNRCRQEKHGPFSWWAVVGVGLSSGWVGTYAISSKPSPRGGACLTFVTTSMCVKTAEL